MPLPEKVIEQLGRDPVKTPGWAFGMVMFCVGLFSLVLFIYLGLVFGYEPYLSNQIQQKQDQINSLGQSISIDDQTKLLNFYSQISNLKNLLHNHTLSSQLLVWLQTNTQANVFYQSLNFSTGNQLQITGVGKTQTDVNQQIAIFETSPQVKQATVSSIGPASQTSGWEFSMTVVFNPAILTFGGLNPPAAPAATPTPAPAGNATTTTPQ